MTRVALIREDTGATLTLYGAQRCLVVYDGKVTEHPVEDRSMVSDGVLSRARVVTLDALVTPRPPDLAATQGPNRVQEVTDWLRTAQQAGAVLHLQRPRRPLLRDLAIERFTDSTDHTDSLLLTIGLKGIRFAQTASVELGALNGGPRPDMEAALTDPVETGTGTSQPSDITQRRSLLATGLGIGGS